MHSVGDFIVVEDSLRACGFVIPTSAATWTLAGGEAAEREDGSVAETMAILALSIVGNRMKRYAYIFRGYPGRAAMLQGGPDTAGQAVKHLQADLQVFQKFMRNAGTVAGVKAVADRCLFHDVAVQQLVEILQVSGWSSTPRVRDWVRESFDGPLNSKIVEDSFKALT